MMEFKEIAQNVFVCLLEDRGFGFNNSGFVNLGGGLVVDTHYDLQHTEKQVEFIASVSNKPPERLVNTHHNGDHTWGNQLYADCEIIAHRLCAEEMQKEKDNQILELLQALKAGGLAAAPETIRWFLEDLEPFDFSGIELTLPNRLIEDRLELELESFPCEILYVGPAHTSNDLIVHLPAHRVVFAGDILFHKCTPLGWEGSHEQWMKAIDTIVSLKPGIIVPGHGPLCGVNELLQQKEYLEYIYEEAREKFSQGITDPLQAAKEIDVLAYREWTEPERVIWTISRAFRDFRGEAWNETFGEAIQLMGQAFELRKYWSH